MKLLSTIRWQWYTFYYGIRNIRLFWRAVWHFDTCDYSPMLELLEIAISAMRDHQRDDGVCVGSERSAKQLTVVAELCRRLRNDDYFDNAGHDPQTWDSLPDYAQSLIARHSHAMSQRDAVYLGHMFKYLQTWWD